MFRDELRDKVWNEVRQHDLRAFAKQLTPEVFAEAARQAGVRIGCSALNLANLVWLGIATAMQHSASFAFVLTTTLKLLEDQENFYSTPLGKQKKEARRAARQEKNGKHRKQPKHRPYQTDPTELTEEAFTQARKRMPLAFWMALLAVLAKQFQRDHAQHLNFKDFRLLAMDGTALTLPNVAGLRKHYGIPKNGQRKKAAPQARMVMVTLPGVRIPIAYEVAPLSHSEVELAGRLIHQHAQPNDLWLVDRGYVSYGLFCQFQRRGAYFGTRLKKNMKYKKLQRFGPQDWLVEWKPKDSRGQWKDLNRSIQLRVIHYQFPGFRASAIVTNALDPEKLSREDWVRLAKDCDDNSEFTPGLYHRRWEIETSFFELKVVLKTKHLRSHKPASLEYELAGRVVYYLLIRWLIVLAAEKHGVEPLRISFTNAVRELEAMRSTLATSAADWVACALLPRLLVRIASNLVPLRPRRHYPRRDDKKPKRRRGPAHAASKASNRDNPKPQNNKRKPGHKA